MINILTSLLWQLMDARQFFFLISHTRTLLSKELLAIKQQLKLKIQLDISALWPSNIPTRLKLKKNSSYLGDDIYCK